ncbi:MAG: hypothetical protein AMS20_07015 [Gemmatimonas sp. SG8_28]|nr:MAG: hypothetical protein AMS20_07015 [Gemmatimonas sp. SG8_28]
MGISCRIRIKGKLDESWSARLGALSVTTLASSELVETVLEGDVPDQAALMGVLNTLGDLNLAVISLDTIERASSDRDQGSAE